MCPVCGRELQRLELGRPRVYCSHVCRQAAYRSRHRVPLGRTLLREWGLPDHSLLTMLREAGIRGPFA